MLIGLRAAGGSKFNGKLAYAIALTRRSLTDVAESYDEVRKELVAKYAKKLDENGNPVEKDGQVELSDPKAFAEEHKAVLDREVEVRVHAVSYELIESADLDPDVVEAILPMIEGDDEDEQGDPEIPAPPPPARKTAKR